MDLKGRILNSNWNLHSPWTVSYWNYIISHWFTNPAGLVISLSLVRGGRLPISRPFLAGGTARQQALDWSTIGLEIYAERQGGGEENRYEPK